MIRASSSSDGAENIGGSLRPQNSRVDSRVSRIDSRLSRIDSRLSRIGREMSNRDASSRYRVEAGSAGVQSSTINNMNNDNNNADQSGSSGTEPEQTIVSWEENDPDNPYNWSLGRKVMVAVMCVMMVMNSTIGSSLPSNGVDWIMASFGVTSEQQGFLPISVYLIGYVLGPLLWAPLSEQYGRRNPCVGTFVFFTIFTLGCALAPNWGALLAFRFLCGVFASAPLAVVSGIFADIFADPQTRGRGMASFMVATLFGPLIAPIMSGYTAITIGWRWSFWIALMFAGFSLLMLLFLPETYGPVLLMRRAQRMRKQDPSLQVIALHESEKKDLTELVTVVLTRPFRMIIYEPIVSSTCLYLAFVYAIFYMSFQAYPFVFEGVYGMSPGECALVYLGIGAGGVLSLPVFIYWDYVLERARQRDAPWTRREEYRRVPLACVGGPIFAAALFWLGWTSREDIPFVVPLLAGIPFGLGYMAIFQALLNYLTDAYEVFAASANAASSCSRALMAVVLPFATTPMFTNLGIAGACSLLGGLTAVMCVVPFVFIWKGEQIRANSRFCTALKEQKEQLARMIEEQREKNNEGAKKTCTSSGRNDLFEEPKDEEAV